MFGFFKKYRERKKEEERLEKEKADLQNKFVLEYRKVKDLESLHNLFTGEFSKLKLHNDDWTAIYRKYIKYMIEDIIKLKEASKNG